MRDLITLFFAFTAFGNLCCAGLWLITAIETRKWTSQTSLYVFLPLFLCALCSLFFLARLHVDKTQSNEPINHPDA